MSTDNSFYCVGCHKTDLKKATWIYKKRNGDSLCCCCSQKAAENNCFKCGKDLHVKKCYPLRHLFPYRRNDGKIWESSFCDDCVPCLDEKITSATNRERIKIRQETERQIKCQRGDCVHSNHSNKSQFNSRVEWKELGEEEILGGKRKQSSEETNEPFRTNKKAKHNHSNSPSETQNTSSKPNQADFNFLTSYFRNRNIKQVTLTNQGELVIEYNSQLENVSHALVKKLTSEEQNNNSELTQIRNYLQTSNKSSVSQQELNNLLSNDNSIPTNNPSYSKGLFVGITGAVLVSIFALFSIGKKKTKR